MRIVQVIWRAHRHVIDFLTASTHLVDVPIKPLKLGKEVGIGKIAVHDPDRVVWVNGDLEFATHSFDRSHVARSDISSRPDQRKISHSRTPPTIQTGELTTQMKHALQRWSDDNGTSVSLFGRNTRRAILSL